VVEACGYEPFLFTSRAELLAVVKGLECINQPAHVIVYTDYQNFLDVLAQLER
jgi:ribonuclease HI